MYSPGAFVKLFFLSPIGRPEQMLSSLNGMDRADVVGACTPASMRIATLEMILTKRRAESRENHDDSLDRAALDSKPSPGLFY